jgi:PAS domain S-box-containing protein/putative nucleotidyltransferase with HDIG domain
MIENISMEITERKEAEQEVREIEAVESSILSAIPHAVIGLQNRVIYFANESVEAIFGYRPEDLIGEKTRILYRSDEEYEQIGRLFYPELEHKHKHSEDFFCRHKDGRDILCKVNASVIGTHMKDQNIVVVYEDITARRQMEQRIVTAAEEWKETFDSMQHGIMLLTPDFQITQINSYLASLYGSLAHDITHKKCFEIISGCDPEEGCPLLKAAGDRSTETLEHFDPRLGKHFMHYITPIFHKDGSIKNFVFCIIDITEIKQKEAEITQSRNAFFNMLKDIDLSYQDLKGLHEGLIHSFVNAIDTKSKWTKGHSERVTLFSVAIARYMKLNREEIEKLRIASLLHDIGKLGTYDVILDKPGRLNAEEYALIKKHPEKGAEILKPIKQLRNIISIVMHHHEQMDGSGYPGGLTGENIPLMARIVHVADSFDSMTADRPYRTAPGKEYAISELKKYSGSQFDPMVVEAFLKVLNTKI